jgi:hypothetical protein
MKIKNNSKFNPEEICRNFIKNFFEIFISENSNEKNFTIDELNSKMTFNFAEFVGLMYIELEKIYENEKEGALFCLAENLIKFFSGFICEEGMDNLLEINPNVFEEMMENGIDLYEESLKKGNMNMNINDINDSEFVAFLLFNF